MTIRIRRFGEYAIAAIAGILGVGSLALFGMFLWVGAFGIVQMRMTQRWTLSWDASICLLFFLQHSGMIRRSFRAGLGRIVPAHFLGILYTIASAVALLLLVTCWQPSASRIYVLEGSALYFTRAVLPFCFAGILWGIWSLGQFDAFGIQALLSDARGQQPRTDKLIIQGPYRLVRHPFYASAIVAFWATPVLSIDRLLLNVLFTIWIVFGATLEERDLLARFGEDYGRYQNMVPMLLPRLFGSRRSDAASRSSAAGLSSASSAPIRRLR